MGSNATTRSKIVELNFFEALSSVDTDRAPINITIKNLATPIELTLLVPSVPLAKRALRTGISSVVGCAVWDETAEYPFWDSQTVSTNVPAKERNTLLVCKTTHTSTFAAIDMQAGCDDSVLLPLKRSNKCGVCKEAELPMDGMLPTSGCDWMGFPCEWGKNECGVCNEETKQTPKRPYRGAPKGSSTALHLAMRNESGICDYRGNPCPATKDPQTGELVYPVVSVCGLCVSRTEVIEGITVKNEGICDCQDSGVPNGGAVVDCCGVCNGFNRALDYCGFIAGMCFPGGTRPTNVPCPPGSNVCPVPRRIPTTLVCYFGLNPKSNLSCTGCDGVPRPELPWNSAPPAVNLGAGVGGKRNDSCGVCGGDSSTCAGCDGVPNSGVVKDTCQVCGGNGESCAGCDNVPRLSPTQEFCQAGGKGAKTCARGAGFRYNCACNYNVLTDMDKCSPGCDGVKGSGLKFDKCGKCGGDGTKCRGCDGVELSGKAYDSVGRCLRVSQHNLGCDGVINSHKRPDRCGDCGGDGTRCAGNAITCIDPAHRADDCGVCRDPAVELDKDDVTCRGCDGIPFSGKLVDRCGVCDGNGRSCQDKLNCIVTPCEFLGRSDYRFDGVDQRLDIWDRCWVYDECGICGPQGSRLCEPKQNSVTSETAVAWVNDISQVVTGVLRVNLDASWFLDSNERLIDPEKQLQFKRSLRETAGVVQSVGGESEHAIQHVDDIVIVKICGKEQTCFNSRTTTIRNRVADITGLKPGPATAGARNTALDQCSTSNPPPWCNAGCKACEVQAKTRPSAGFSDVYLRVVTNRRDAVKKHLSRLD